MVIGRRSGARSTVPQIQETQPGSSELRSPTRIRVEAGMGTAVSSVEERHGTPKLALRQIEVEAPGGGGGGRRIVYQYHLEKSVVGQQQPVTKVYIFECVGCGGQVYMPDPQGEFSSHEASYEEKRL